ncbi:hypothetical protein JCGZ_24703 [Jatropha curcas]|uniref:Growth-regulating factor n=1 Tax=Jatropha curcas TaxID=180498 RepID=A0A067L9G9_JATCU|nr:hypothetical protein JCGZ_24703 [Jatropha curcas]
MGFGRKADPEPGRCRRTDGKKWRCSKEAYPDSKYCERHMHRGRNRSRKPVELTSTTTTTATTTAATITMPSTTMNNRNLSTATSPNSSSSSYSFSHLSSPVEPEFHTSHGSSLNPFLYTHSSSSRPMNSGFSSQNNTAHHLFLDSGSSSSHADKGYRYLYGMKEDVDERTFFPETSGSERGLQDSYQQLTMSSYKGYSQSQFENLADTSNQQQDQQQHCFVLVATKELRFITGSCIDPAVLQDTIPKVKESQ